jgi:hypothetical protein
LAPFGDRSLPGSRRSSTVRRRSEGEWLNRYRMAMRPYIHVWISRSANGTHREPRGRYTSNIRKRYNTSYRGSLGIESFCQEGKAVARRASRLILSEHSGAKSQITLASGIRRVEERRKAEPANSRRLPLMQVQSTEACLATLSFRALRSKAHSTGLTQILTSRSSRTPMRDLSGISSQFRRDSGSSPE